MGFRAGSATLLQPANGGAVQVSEIFHKESAMKLSILAAAIVLVAASTTPRTAHAAGQPQLSPQQSAAATDGKTPDQAEKSKIEVKRESDAQKYQGKDAENTKP
jgi:hypothetical protein